MWTLYMDSVVLYCFVYYKTWHYHVKLTHRNSTGEQSKAKAKLIGDASSFDDELSDFVGVSCD